MFCLHTDLAQAWASFGEAKSVVSEACQTNRAHHPLVDVQHVRDPGLLITFVFVQANGLSACL